MNTLRNKIRYSAMNIISDEMERETSISRWPSFLRVVTSSNMLLCAYYAFNSVIGLPLFEFEFPASVCVTGHRLEVN